MQHFEKIPGQIFVITRGTVLSRPLFYVSKLRHLIDDVNVDQIKTVKEETSTTIISAFSNGYVILLQDGLWWLRYDG